MKQQIKEEIKNRKNYIAVYNTSNKKYELSEVEVERVWWSSFSVLQCRLSNGWVVCSDYLFKNKSIRNQKQLLAKFNMFFWDKRNYYFPNLVREEFIKKMFNPSKKDYRSFYVPNKI